MDVADSGSRRALKRALQACEPCRRKKSRCPGEKPACSQCVRLNQQCVYADDGPAAERAVSIERRMDVVEISEESRICHADLAFSKNARLAQMESKLEELLQSPHVVSSASGGTPSRSHDVRSYVASPIPTHIDGQATSTQPSRLALPPLEDLKYLVHNFMYNCNGQPILLFHPSLMDDFETRDPALLAIIIALSSRFGDRLDLPLPVHAYATESRASLMKEVHDGSVRLSTIQGLVLLAFLDLTNSCMQRSCLTLQIAKTLSNLAMLSVADPVKCGTISAEEQRRCAWSIWSFEQIMNPCNLSFQSLGLEYIGPPPRSPGIESHGMLSNFLSSSTEFDQQSGIMVHLPRLYQIWGLSMKYLKNTKEGQCTTSMWHQDSEYNRIMSALFDFESGIPLEHRFDRAQPGRSSREAVVKNWPYWSSWLSCQITYHTILILLNHPLPTSVRLRTSERYPRTFIQSTTDLVMLHSTWILRIFDMLEEMCLAITDPFLGFCTAIAATVFLQFSLADGSPISGVAEAGLIRAKEVMQSLSSRWPILSKVSELLRGLEQIEKAQARTASVTTPQTEAAREALIWRVLLFDAAKEAEPAPETIFAETMGPRRDEQTLQPVHPAIADTSANTGFVPSAADPPLQTRVDPLMAPPFSRLTPVDGIVQPDLLSMADMMGASPARAFDEWWSYGPL